MTDVLVERTDHVAVVTLNRPDRLNALTQAMVEQLRGVLDDLAETADVRVVVLTGAGRGFCAGGDVSDLAPGAPEPREPGTHRPPPAEVLRGCTRVVEIMRAMPQPVLAAVNGPCAGAGLSLACAADLRLASSEAVFTTAFVAVGQTGDYGLAWTLPRLVGAGRARELLLTGRRVSAEDALRMGLVEEVCAPGALRARVAELAVEIAGRAPLTVAAMKANLVAAETMALGEFLDLEAERFQANAGTEDAAEAARAYLERRAPRFRGR